MKLMCLKKNDILSHLFDGNMHFPTGKAHCDGEKFDLQNETTK